MPLTQPTGGEKFRAGIGFCNLRLQVGKIGA